MDSHKFVHIQGREVPITYSGLDDDEDIVISAVQSFPPFESWVVKMGREVTFIVDEVVVHHIEYYKGLEGARVGLCKIHVKLVNESGTTFPSTFVVRGTSVLCIISYYCDGIDHIVVTHQVRPAVGRTMTELPNGLLDVSGNFKGRTADTLERILPSLSLTQKYLIDLLHVVYGDSQLTRLYPTPQSSDESTRIMLYRRIVTSSQLEDIRSQLMQNRSSPPPIAFSLSTLNELQSETDAKLLSAAYLFKKVLGLKNKGNHLFCTAD